MFPETLVTTIVAPTPVPLFSLMNGCMAAETGCCHERLVAAWLGADIVALLSMGALDVLLQVFLFQVILVTALKGASEGSVVVV
jgi:hypothetical protein